MVYSKKAILACEFLLLFVLVQIKIAKALMVLLKFNDLYSNMVHLLNLVQKNLNYLKNFY